MEIAGLPLHPLVIHAVVALVPVAVLLAWALALLPGARWLTRWPALLAALAAVAAAVVAQQSGQDLLAAQMALMPEGAPVPGDIATHRDRANVLVWLVVLLATVVSVAFWALPAPSGLVTGRLHHDGGRAPAVTAVLRVALLLAGALALVWVVLTGDAGARAVWGGR